MGAARTRGARRLLVGALAAALVGATLLAAAPAGASGGAEDPPGWVDPGDGAWVVFTIENPNAVPIDRDGNYLPVMVTRGGDLKGVSLEDAFPTWPSEDHDGDLTPELGWPLTFSTVGGATLERAAWCNATDVSCAYNVVSAGAFWFAGGTPLGPDGTTPDFSAFPEAVNVAKPIPEQIVATISWTKGAPGELGKLVLDGGLSQDPLGGTLTFTWSITGPNGLVFPPGTGQVLTQGIDEPGEYCIALSVESSVPGAQPPPVEQCVTFTDAEVPAKPGPGGGGGGTVGVPAGGGGDQIATVVFAQPAPRRARFGLSGGSAAPTVVWLWRPEWYSENDQRPARSTGQPRVKGKQEILVDRGSAPEGASAGPWLAGLGAFGLIGVGVIVSRKRRLRLEP